MTLGGLALSVGILVDQAIVTIENIERHLHDGAELHEAILVGAGEIGVPAFVSTLCICIVFVPMFFLSGVARFLFVPMAEAVVFAMIASYILSRTLVPTLVMLMMGRTTTPAKAEPFKRSTAAFDAQFERVRDGYTAVLARGARTSARAFALRVLRLLRAVLPALPGARPRLLPERGRRPDPPALPRRRPARASRRPRASPTASRPTIRELIPKDQLETILDNLGVPNSEHQPLVQQLRHHRHARRRDPDVAEEGPPPDRGVRDAAARRAAEALPRHRVLLPARPTSSRRSSTSACPRRSTCSSPAPNLAQNAALAAELDQEDPARSPARSTCTCTSASTTRRRPADGPHAAAADGPVGVQRRAERAARRSPAARRPRPRSGSTRRTAWSTTSRCRRRSTAWTRSTRCSTSRWPPPAPARRTSPTAAARQPRRGARRQQLPPWCRATTSRPAIDVYVSVQGTDLASVATQVQKLVDEMKPKLPRGSQVTMRGQVETMQDSFVGLGVGLADGDRAGLPADRRQLPVVDRRRHHHRRAARRARRHRVDAVHHRHHALGAGADRARS